MDLALTPSSIITELHRPEPWTEDGNCLLEDPDLWHADPHSREGVRARELCFSCPVKLTCREAAEARGEQFGIWGGEDFNDPEQTRCQNGHWEDENSRSARGRCLACRADASRAYRKRAA